MKGYWKYYNRLRNGEKIPRKAKKLVLGLKLNKSKLRKRLNAVCVIRMPYPQSAVLTDTFCPRCGCNEVRAHDHHVGYPERWIQNFCLRCGYLVAETDNSPWYHCLEFRENGYAIGY